jgi:hypothetical protein
VNSQQLDAAPAGRTDMDPSRPLTLIAELKALTEAQLHAAVALDGAKLARLNHDRADLVFNLQIALQECPQTLRGPLLEALADLRTTEDRLSRIAQTVVGTLDKVAPRPDSPQPKTYGRTGRMG